MGGRDGGVWEGCQGERQRWLLLDFLWRLWCWWGADDAVALVRWCCEWGVDEWGVVRAYGMKYVVRTVYPILTVLPMM